jgi:hypothetical protein
MLHTNHNFFRWAVGTVFLLCLLWGCQSPTLPPVEAERVIKESLAFTRVDVCESCKGIAGDRHERRLVKVLLTDRGPDSLAYCCYRAEVLLELVSLSENTKGHHTVPLKGEAEFRYIDGKWRLSYLNYRTEHGKMVHLNALESY